MRLLDDTNSKVLTERMVIELIESITAYHVERVDGIVNQKIIIMYNCIGELEVPSWKNISDFDIMIETRNCVALCYTPMEKAR